MLLLLVACSGEFRDPDAPREAQAVLAVKGYVALQLGELERAASDVQAAAPLPDADGWAGGEAGALQGAWRDARVRYERVEGAIAVLFPDLDAAADGRYDGFLAAGPDEYLFDDEGVVGMHAVERVAWADAVPPYVLAFEGGLAGYLPPAFPANEGEAADFRDLLAQRLADDTAEMADRFEPLALGAATAFLAVTGSIAEQRGKVALAQSGEDESRYAQHSLADMRANLEGSREIYAAFAPWLREADGGAALDDEIQDGFDRVQDAYDAIDGDAVPEVPETWNPDFPSDADLETEYGQLWSALRVEADPTEGGALAERLAAAGDLLGLL